MSSKLQILIVDPQNDFCIADDGHGNKGTLVVPGADTLTWWERQFMARVDYIVKGNNPWTEHFSGVKAEVPDPKDIGTQLNTHLIGILEEADIVALTGEALSHCVANTVTDIANAFADPATIRKLVLLTDCTSNVGGFDFLGRQFIADLTKKGMRLETADSFLA